MSVLSRKQRRIFVVAISLLALLGIFLISRISPADETKNGPVGEDKHETSLKSPPDLLSPPNQGDAIKNDKSTPINAVLQQLIEEDVHSEADAKLRKNIHYTSYLYSGFQQFVDSFGLVQDASAADLGTKCSRFFSQLSQSKPDWKLQRFPEFSDKIHDTESLLDVVEGDLKRDWERSPGNTGKKFEFNDEQQAKAKIIMNKMVENSVRDLHQMDDTTTIMRILGRCFFNNDKKRDLEVYNEYTNKLFPFFSGKLPRYFRGDSSVPVENALPVFNKKNKYTESLIPYDAQTGNLVEFFRNNINGRGIVVSATDKFKNDLIGLIRVLRATDNLLPIQIVHLGDLSPGARTELFKHATLPIENLLRYKHAMGSDENDLLQYANTAGLKFPRQEIWFVDILNCVASEYKRDFSNFFAKLLAYFFNSFSEVLFMDADAVPLVTPESLFNSKEYKKSGTYFFKDRAMQRVSRYINGATFLGFSPMNDVSIDTLFDIPLLTQKTTNNLYFQGWFHLQEAGIVLMNRKKHFLGTLMTFPLIIWANVIDNMVYGDKELYWLGLAMAGDENYEFNANSAAAAGTVFIDPSRGPDQKIDYTTVCSTHPAHVNDEGKLLWINSGFQFCKNNGWQEDRSNPRFKAFTDDELINLYTQPPTIEVAVVPPNPAPIWAPGLPCDAAEWARVKSVIEYYQSPRAKDGLITGGNDLMGLQAGWTATDACARYEYRASSKVVSYHTDKLYDYGKFYSFSAEDTQRYKFYGKVWMYAYE